MIRKQIAAAAALLALVGTQLAYAASPVTVTSTTGQGAAVKAPSTAAVAADPGLVVSLSPNNPITTGLPSALPAGVGTDGYVPVRPLPPSRFSADFNGVYASTVSPIWTVITSGSGQAISQTGGNLVVTSGTTANSETIIRSTQSFTNALTMKWQASLSQRIANNNFYVELVDVIGNALPVTVNSATSVTITFPSTTLPDGTTIGAANVGQSMEIGAISGVAGIPGRYAISAVSGTAVTFTVAAWPATGAGIASVYGWNYYQTDYAGTTATQLNFDAQRRGYNTGATVATINTSASPGHMGIINSEDGAVTLLDQLVASSAVIQTTVRASRVLNIPPYNVPLYLQVHMLNGTVAPASTTTMTMNTAQVDAYTPQTVGISNVKPQSNQSAAPVVIASALPAGAATIGAISALPAGAAVIGQVSINQTTLGTTNGVEEVGRLFNEITTATTTLVKSGSTVVSKVNVGTCVAAATIKLYNAITATGTPVTITCPATVTDPFTLIYDMTFGTGLTVVTSGLTDVTITYR